MSRVDSTSQSVDRDLSQVLGGLSLEGFVDLDALRRVVVLLAQRSEVQDRKLSAVTQELAETKSVLPKIFDRLDHLESSVVSLQHRVSAVENACVSQIHDKKYTAGELATSNYFQLQHLTKLQSTFMTHVEAAPHIENLISLTASHGDLSKLVDRLGRASDEISLTLMQVTAAQTRTEKNLHDKMDRSELPFLQSLVARVSQFDTFRTTTVSELAQALKDITGTQESIRDHAKELGEAQKNIANLSQELPRFASKRDVHVLARELKTHQEWLQRCAESSKLKELCEEVEAHKETLIDTRRELHVNINDVRALQKEVPTKVPLTRLGEFVRVDRYEPENAQIHQLISQKTEILFSQRLDENITEVSSLLDAERKRVDIALEFVNWFTQRGQHHEHNIKILDRHLSDLVSSNKTPRVHSVFLPQNQVVFQSGPQSDKIDSRVVPR